MCTVNIEYPLYTSWSPDGNTIACTIDVDSKRNIVLWDVSSLHTLHNDLNLEQARLLEVLKNKNEKNEKAEPYVLNNYLYAVFSTLPLCIKEAIAKTNKSFSGLLAGADISSKLCNKE